MVAWFGDDLRANACTLKPGVVDRTTATTPETWQAAGLTRATARLVSTYDGKPAFGGTPSDASVVAAIRDLKTRGLGVTLYPFVMMDIPAGNGLADPYGGAEQDAYPWRGSITLSVAPGEPGSPDKTAAAATEIAAFVGTAAAGDFSLSGDTVVYSGPDEWTLRRQVLHYAWLCKAAGGVDAFLIGSELRGLTTVRSAAATYPFVDALVALAADVRAVLGAGTEISYAADWSEYFGHHPDDGSGDVTFHLDPLWADGNVDFVAIDNYMPLSDWRDGNDHLDAATWDSGRDVAYLRANIAGGEYYDWYYASAADRDAQTRTPITDGAYGKPWVFRPKDLVSWWTNEHFDRPAGVEAASPTAWVPQSKPIRFTECGCPAVDKGPNQPNVFPDPKSAAGGLPYYSTGLRDDLIQRRFIAATLAYWDPDDADFDEAANPVSSVYGGRMVDHTAIHLWTWDARPFPAFPLLTDVWADSANWETGHWLNGRLGALTAEALVAQILADYGADDSAVDDLDGTVDGYLIGDIASAREALTPLSQLLMFEGFESGDVVPRRAARPARVAGLHRRRSGRGRRGAAAHHPPRRRRPSCRRRSPSASPTRSPTIASSSVSSRRLVGGSRRLETTDTGAVISYAVASGIADTILQDIWAGRETVSLALPQRALALEPADVCTIAVDDGRAHGARHPGRGCGAAADRGADHRARHPGAGAGGGAGAAAARGGARFAAGGGAARPAADHRQRGRLRAAHRRLRRAVAGGDRAVARRLRTPASSPRQTIAATRGDGGAHGAAGGGAGRALGPRQHYRGRALWRRAGQRTAPGGAERRQPRRHRLRGDRLRGDPVRERHADRRQYVAARRAVARSGRHGRHHGGGACDRRPLRPSRRRGAVAGAERGRIRPRPHAYAAGRRARSTTRPSSPTWCSARRAVASSAWRRSISAASRDTGSGDVTFTWIRQTRIGGDQWDQVEVPLGEASEAYQVAILDGGDTVRTLTAATPSVVYTAADQTADFGGLPSDIAVAISQVSPTEGAGVAATDLLHV